MGMAWSCLRGPRLLRVGAGLDYAPGAAESYAQAVLTSLSCALSLAAYTSPILLPWAYRSPQHSLFVIIKTLIMALSNLYYTGGAG